MDGTLVCGPTGVGLWGEKNSPGFQLNLSTLSLSSRAGKLYRPRRPLSPPTSPHSSWLLIEITMKSSSYFWTEEPHFRCHMILGEPLNYRFRRKCPRNYVLVGPCDIILCSLFSVPSSFLGHEARKFVRRGGGQPSEWKEKLRDSYERTNYDLSNTTMVFVEVSLCTKELIRPIHPFFARNNR